VAFPGDDALKGRPMRRILQFAAIGAMALLCGAVGCHKDSEDDSLPSDYGTRRDLDFESSVNGYSVLADMFVAAGHTVSIRETLSPGLRDSADVIVWPPDSFNVPDKGTIAWMDDWLKEKPDRMLIYIGRDFDAAPGYWRKIREDAPPEALPKIDEELQNAETAFAVARAEMPKSASCDWFRFDNTIKHSEVRSLAGEWSEGIDAAKVDIELNSRMIPNSGEDLFSFPHEEKHEEKHLADDGTTTVETVTEKKLDTLVNCQNITVYRAVTDYRGSPGRAKGGTSQLFLVANGSFLVNVQLVNHEHRKLASQLIAAVRGEKKHVVFIGSYDPIPPIRKSGSDESPHTMLDLFDAWPRNAIFIQWGIVIVALCFSRWAIFGLPRDPPPPATSDFGRHVSALGEALALTRDETYAQSRWESYQQIAHGSKTPKI